MCHLWEELHDDGIRTFCVERILVIMMLGTLNVPPRIGEALQQLICKLHQRYHGVSVMNFQSYLYGFESLELSDVKIYLVFINSNFTYCIVHKCVLIVCKLASLLLDTLNQVKNLGYCIANRQISSGTNACKNTQARLCSIVRASLVILLCP